MSKPVTSPAKRTRAKKSVAAPPKPRPCVVCGGDVAPLSNEELCWVCRRLKISAWRENDNQPQITE
jgi:hypothetical protein